jgi:CheY-like chemotaxis protein
VNVFFLDDDSYRHSVVRVAARRHGVQLVAVRTVDDALDAIEAQPFDLILLDHDLDGQTYVPSGPGTGYEVATAIPASVNAGTPVIVHSLNEQGARAMIDAIGPTAQWVPFPQLHLHLATLFAPRRS